MFCNAYLKDAEKIVCIPVKWVKQINLRKISRPISTKRDYTVFFSPNEDDVPDFTTMVPTTPDNFEYQKGAYVARIQQSFGKQTTNFI